MVIKMPTAASIVVAAFVVVSQAELAWFLRRDWERLLSRRALAALLSLLCLVWVVLTAGLAIDLLGWQYASNVIPRGFSVFAVAFSIIWGFASVISINIYAVGRVVLRRSPHSPSRRRAIQTVTAAAMAAPVALTGYGALIQRTAYRVTEIDFPVPHLHPDLEGLRVVQISDLHVSPFLSVREAGRVVDIANELKPRLTLVTGDLITQTGDPLDGTIRELGRLRAEAGVLGCMGNHEIYARCQNYTKSEAARVGIVFLRHEAVPLRWGQGVLNVAGVDFQRFGTRKHYIPGAESLILPGAANLLLSHNPDVFPTAVSKGYDAMVSGHTHGGQVTVEILNQTANLARFFTPFVAGLYRQDGRSCYVNAGIGTIGMPVRLGAPPEITLFRLRGV